MVWVLTCWVENGDSSALCCAEKGVHADAVQSLLLQISEAVAAAGLVHHLLLGLLV